MTSSALTVRPPRRDFESFANSWAPAAHPMAKHATKMLELQRNCAARSMNNACMTAQVFAHGFDSESWRELWDMQTEIWRRMQAMQIGWMEDWKDWSHYAAEVKGANTMTKLVERECNVPAQFAQLLATQMTKVIALQENIHIDYTYWIAQKLNEIQARAR